MSNRKPKLSEPISDRESDWIAYFEELMTDHDAANEEPGRQLPPSHFIKKVTGEKE
jgi:hypothetical protein